jgi:hypothetical protein
MPMDEEPELPEPVPEIPRGPLWSTLLVPPVLTLILNLGIGNLDRIGSFLGLSLWVPPIVIFIIVILAFKFTGITGGRYRGRSMVFLNLAYLLGQIIVCLVLWIGSCVLIYPPQGFR